MFPTILSSVESALTILDYAIRFAKFLSPSFKNFLERTRSELGKIDSDTPIIDANKIFDQKLPAFVPLPEVETLSWNLNHVLEVVKATVEGLNMETGLSGVKGLPTYGWALNFGFQKLTEKLRDWGFFLHSGIYIPATRQYSKVLRSQPMKQEETYLKPKFLTTSLRSSQKLMGNVPLLMKFASTYIGFNTVNNLLITNLSYLHSAGNPIEYLECVGISFYGYTINFSKTIRRWNGNNLFSSDYVPVTLSNADFEQLAAGLVADTLFFADRVKRERFAVAGTLDRLYDLFKRK